MGAPVNCLYLQKDEKEDIFIDKRLPQYQIDGIRFLYIQYKKKKPGVILNHPVSYGSVVQTVLFLHAARHILENPVLIICSQGFIDKWKTELDNWFTDDSISENQPNPYIKKAIHINTFECVSSFQRRQWSVVIIHCDAANKDVLKCNFKSDYKVWVTAVNLKENLNDFSVIYKWLYPKGQFNPDDYIANPRSLKDVISVAILLDNFMEDIVIRRDNCDEINIESKNKSPKIVETPQKVTRKNKDATGTKIKRSKQKSEDSIGAVCNKIDVNLENNDLCNNLNIIGAKDKINESDSFNVPYNGSIYNKDNKYINEEKSVLGVDLSNNSDCVVDSNMKDINKLENYLSKNNLNNKLVIDKLETINDTIRSKVIDPINKNFENLTNKASSKIEIVEQTEDADSNGMLMDFANAINEIEVNENEIQVNANKMQVNENKMQVNENKIQLNENEIQENENKIQDSAINEDMDLSVNNLDNQQKENNHEVSILKKFDNKLLELEEQTYKKFKGSILDRLF